MVSDEFRIQIVHMLFKLAIAQPQPLCQAHHRSWWLVLILHGSLSPRLHSRVSILLISGQTLAYREKVKKTDQHLGPLGTFSHFSTYFFNKRIFSNEKTDKSLKIKS